MLKNSPPPDTSEEIIDLTEIIQKGKAPLQTKDVVDFDSALSDLMGKVPSVKMKDTPELEELLSGIDEVAQTRSRLRAREDDEEDSDSVVNLSDMDDVDSLVSSLEKTAPDKNRQPAEDVDSLLDSLMDDIDPPAAAHKRSGPEVSEADLDELLDTIEQESTGKDVKAEDDGAYSMDDLLSGLDKVHKNPPKAAAKPEPKPAPDSLDDLLSSLDAPAAPKAAAKPEPKPAPDSLDDLLSSLDEPAAPKAAAKPEPKPAPDSLDDLLSSLDAPAAPKAAAKPEPKPAPDSLDDLLSSLDAPAAPKAAAKPEPKPAPDSLDDLLSSLDAPAAPKAAAKPEPAPVNPDVERLNELLKDKARQAAAAKADSAPKAEERVDFGDLGTMLESAQSARDSADADDEIPDVFTKGPDDSDDLDGAALAEDDESDVLASAAFDTDDLADLDSLFADKTAKTAKAPTEPAAAPAAPVASASGPEFLASFLEDVAVEPVAPVPPETAVPFAEPAESAPVANADFEALKNDVEGLRAKVQELETAVATPVVPDEETMLRLLEPGSPIHARLLDIVREAMAEAVPTVDTAALEQQLDQRLADLEGQVAGITAPKETETSVAGQLTVLESRLNALETMLTQVAAQVSAGGETHPEAEALESLARRVQVMEERQQDLGWERQEADNPLAQRLATLEARPYVPLETIQNAFDQMGAQINGPLQQFQNRITALETRLGDDISLFAEELIPLMSQSIDRAAADSAARALREELAAMLGDGEEADEPDDADETDADEADAVDDADEADAVDEADEVAAPEDAESVDPAEDDSPDMTAAAEPDDPLPSPPAVRRKKVSDE